MAEHAGFTIVTLGRCSIAMSDDTGSKRIAESRDWPIRRLIERLRRLGAPIQRREAEQILFLAAGMEEWPRERLKQVVLTLVAGGRIERRLVDDAFDAVFPREQLTVRPFPPARADDPATSTAEPSQYIPLWRADTAGSKRPTVPISPSSLRGRREANAVLQAGSDIWRGLLADKLGLTILLLSLCGLAAVAVFMGGSCCAPAPPVPSSNGSVPVPLLAYGVAALAAAGLFGPMLFMLRWATRSQAVVQPRAQSSSSGSSGTTMFRIGLVGGPPPRALDSEGARTIGDLFAYGPGDEERRELDIERSIDAILRSGGMPMIRHPPARILPTVLLLVDEVSSARFWNTLPQEAATALGQRGLDLRVITFPGSLHGYASSSVKTGTGGGTVALLPTPAGRAVAATAEDESYTAVLVFSDAANWREEDTALLRGLMTKGPVFWFDDRDRELWDASLDGIRHVGIPIWEATAAGLEEALRSAFAPGRGVGTKARTAGGALRRRGAPELGSELRALLGSAFDWAGHCSYSEPISFGLADRIRRELHPRLSWIAFSRLTALPGSLVGPEGLRFDSAVRSYLLAHMAHHEPSRRRDKAVELITSEFAKMRDGLPLDAPARAIADLAIARVEVHRNPDKAVHDLRRLRNDGLVEPEPINAFLKQLRLAKAGAAPESRTDGPVITIGARIWEAETLAAIDSSSTGTSLERPKVSWAVSTPELRRALSTGAPTNGSAIQAGFLTEDRLILIEPSAQDKPSARIIELPSGLEGPPLVLQGWPSRLVAGVGICLVTNMENEVQSLVVPSGGTPAASFPSFTSIEEESPIRLLAVDAVRHAGLVFTDYNLRTIGPDNPLDPVRLNFEEAAGAACALGDDLLVGTVRGSFHVLTAGGISQRLGGPLLPGPIQAVAAAAEGNGGRSYRVAAAYSSGVSAERTFYFVTLFTVVGALGSSDTSRTIERPGMTIPLTAASLALELSVDGATLLVRSAAGIAILDTATGLSIMTWDAEELLASLAADGTIPAQVVAADLAARRIAILTSAPPRLEIRRLERIEGENPAPELSPKTAPRESPASGSEGPQASPPAV